MHCPITMKVGLSDLHISRTNVKFHMNTWRVASVRLRAEGGNWCWDASRRSQIILLLAMYTMIVEKLILALTGLNIMVFGKLKIP